MYALWLSTIIKTANSFQKYSTTREAIDYTPKPHPKIYCKFLSISAR